MYLSLKRVFVLVVVVGLVIVAIFIYLDWRQKEERIFYFLNIKETKDAKSKSHYTFMTYNIQLGFNYYDDPWDRKQIGGTEDNLIQIVEAIKSIDPDVVALQEVAKNRSNAKIKNQIKFLAKKLNMNYAYGDHGENDVKGFFHKGRWGNAILSKYRIIAIQNHEIFYKNRWSRRSCLEATIQFSQGSVTVFSTHFEFSGFESEIKNTLELIQKSTNPVVLMGDFNLFTTDDRLTPILKRLSDTCKEVDNENSLFVQQYGTIGLPERKVVRCPFCDKPLPFGCRIDHIFISPQIFEVVDVGLLPKKYWKVSDHVAYFAKLKFKK